MHFGSLSSRLVGDSCMDVVGGQPDGVQQSVEHGDAEGRGLKNPPSRSSALEQVYHRLLNISRHSQRGLHKLRLTQ